MRDASLIGRRPKSSGECAKCPLRTHCDGEVVPNLDTIIVLLQSGISSRSTAAWRCGRYAQEGLVSALCFKPVLEVTPSFGWRLHSIGIHMSGLIADRFGYIAFPMTELMI